jgi:hypothetical protein
MSARPASLWSDPLLADLDRASAFRLPRPTEASNIFALGLH